MNGMENADVPQRQRTTVWGGAAGELIIGEANVFKDGRTDGLPLKTEWLPLLDDEACLKWVKVVLVAAQAYHDWVQLILRRKGGQ